MRWTVRIIGLAMIFAFFQESLAARIEDMWPSLKGVYVMPFISNSYEWPGDSRGVPVIWWIKYCLSDISRLIIMVCFTKLAPYVSNRLTGVGLVYCLYCLVDFFMLWFNYKQSSGWYWYLDIVAVILIFIPEKKKNPVKSIK